MSRRGVAGFRFGGVHCGIKSRGLDLALIASEEPAAWAGVFTQSSVVGAPVTWSRSCVTRGRGRAFLVNSGISNVAMGKQGERNVREMAHLAAQELGCLPGEICVASTGVIGEPLPMDRIRKGIPKVSSALGKVGFRDAAEAIRTTDTYAKLAECEVKVAGRAVRVLGMAKGSGMVEPQMATMLAFLVTDAAVAPAYLRRVLRRASDVSFNRVSVDGETSTSDMALVLANGRAGNPVLSSDRSRGASRFQAAVDEVAIALARDLARDGEGATKLVDILVTGGRTRAEAESAGRRIANSMLVKTALFGGDPNWGRILQTVGAAKVRIRLDRATVRLGGVAVFRNGRPLGPKARQKAQRQLRRSEIRLEIHLGTGRACAEFWTCDLSTEYVRINAEYTT